ncbi:hypothetical protein QAD02_010907 [Eretmocerus hayati]|uniref:Uncharacterized protein n=1 Tax=Eretmocerus hayati TaxID=131215 RepID=A0ACC2NWD2_9HYME|nr:hypothetical protein QAD02_010907 [Eretmocerus hayati]
MHLKIVLCLAIFTSFQTRSWADESQPPMEYIIGYIKDNLSTYQVTVMTKSINALGSFSSSIVKTMIDEFSSVVVDTSTIERPSMSVSEKLWNRTVDQSKLKIGIVELQHNSDTFKELSYVLDFFMTYSEFVRGKCIIFLVNGNGQSLEQFLNYAWSKDFLDLTVIEWIDEGSKKTIQSGNTSTKKVLNHVFDPFKKIYTRNILTNKTNILPNKVMNLRRHRFNLSVDKQFIVYYDRNYTKKGRIFTYHGKDTIRMRLIAEALNFTANTHFVDETSFYSADSGSGDIFLVTRFKSLEEIANSDIDLRVDDDTKYELTLQGKYNSVFQKVARMAVAVGSETDLLRENVTDTVLIGHIKGPMHSDHSTVTAFSEQNKYLTVAQENIRSSIGVLPLRNNFPLKDEFGRVFWKLFETGLLTRSSEIDNYMSLRDYYRSKEHQAVEIHWRNTERNDEMKEISLSKKFTLIMVIGYSSAFIVLACEMIVNKINLIYAYIRS